MQLNGKPAALRLGLMAATCSLLAPPLHAQTDTESPSDAEQSLKIDSGLLYYKESLGRIQSYDAIVDLKKDFGDEHILDAHIAYDSLSGGSPNGAVPTHTVQTFATPSGTSMQAAAGSGPVTYTTASGRVVAQLAKVTLYTVEPGQLPLDPNFHDQRVAGDLAWSQPVGLDNHLAVGAHLSHEMDFFSAAGNLSFSHDFNRKNTTLGLGLSGEYDQVKPIGGVPVAGSDYTLLQKTDNRSKQVFGAQLGITQVLARNWITQFNVSYDKSQGYLTDPYKILSLVDASGTVTGYRYERRPEDRTRKSLYWGNKIALGDTVVDASYRHGMDSWGIRSDTVEGRYRFTFGNPDIYFEPHLRCYKQSRADFYNLYLDASSALPDYMSADPRLAAFTGVTVGLKVGLVLADEQELTFRLEAYQQNPVQQHSSLAGLSGLDLNPELRSILFQVNWRIGY
jgi:hypothetical protein